MESEEIRKDFPVFTEREDLAYLDSAATSHKPEKVIEAVSEFYRTSYASVGRGIYDLAGEASEEYRKARSKAADFIGASSSEVVFVRNTTEAENLLADSLEFEGDVVLSEMAHHSEQLPWRRRARRDGKEVEFLDTSNRKISVESAREKIDRDTCLVAISHVSNVFGAENPVDEIAEIAHEKDALVVLDAAQSAPRKSLDVDELHVDFVCFSGHKMLGPSSTGVLYGKKDLLEEMEPFQVGGGMVKSVGKNSVEYSEVPGKFEAGTENVAGAVGLRHAIDYLEDVGMGNIWDHDLMISREIRKGLEEMEGVKVFSPENSCLVSFKTEFAHPHDVAEILNHEGVAVRAGHHCAQPQMESLDVPGTVRASPYLYNTERDVEKLIGAVEKAQEIFD